MNPFELIGRNVLASQARRELVSKKEKRNLHPIFSP